MKRILLTGMSAVGKTGDVSAAGSERFHMRTRSSHTAISPGVTLVCRRLGASVVADAARWQASERELPSRRCERDPRSLEATRVNSTVSS